VAANENYCRAHKDAPFSFPFLRRRLPAPTMSPHSVRMAVNIKSNDDVPGRVQDEKVYFARSVV
jgi:hypothetical protein